MEITFKVNHRKDGVIMLHGVLGEQGIHLNLNKFKENLEIVYHENTSAITEEELIEKGKQHIAKSLQSYGVSFCISGWEMNLSPEMKEFAEMLAMGLITFEDMENVYHIKKEDLPRRFFNYMKTYRKQIESEVENAEDESFNNVIKRATTWDLVDPVLNAIDDGVSLEDVCNIYNI